MFTIWLSKNPKACGYKPPNSKCLGPAPVKPSKTNATKVPSARLKSTARKEAKEAAVGKQQPKEPGLPLVPVVMYTVTTKDLLDQANAVA